MDEKTREALEGSIRKWEAIVTGTDGDKGRTNCPLCAMFFTVPSASSFLCGGCPVREKTRQTSCSGSPYTEWANHDCNYDEDAIDGEGVRVHDRCPECLRLATAELDFLKSLRPKELAANQEDTGHG